jgi:hypothetical protein
MLRRAICNDHPAGVMVMRIVAIGLALAMTVAPPASAQIWGGTSPSLPSAGPRDLGAGRDLGKASRDIRDGSSSNQLSRREARSLRRERNAIRSLESRYARNGISDSERAEIQTRLEILRSETVARRTRGMNK